MQVKSANVLATLSLVICFSLTACNKASESSNTAITQQVQPIKIKPIKPSENPQPKKPQYNAVIVNFDGFGPAKFGDNEESVRMSWGRPLNASKPAAGATCYTLNIEPLPANHQGISFMLEDAKFVRYDVTDTTIVAPGNIMVGDTKSTVMSAHAGHIESQPQKYVEGGQNLIVTPENQANTRLIFELDAHDIVTRWRIGVIPQIYFVEGCS